MATLTETAYYTRQGLKFTFFAVLALLLLRFLVGGAISVWQNIRPVSPLQPTVAFGKLSPIKFPTGKTPTKSITYTQEFVGGGLPESSSSAKVYFTPSPGPNFLSLERSNEFARSLGFNVEAASLTPILYLWADSEYPARTLQKDIVNGNFLLTYDYNADRSALAEKSLPYGKTATSEAWGFLGRYGLNLPDLSEEGGVVSFWQFTGSALISTPSVSEADIVRVDFFRSPVDNLPLVTSSFKEAPVYFLLSGSGGKKRILTLYYIFRTIEHGIFATYPLKTTSEAWEELVAQKGYIANFGGVKGYNVTIRKVYLAYYDSEVYESYLQPIFVFEGDEGFRVYVPAVTREWVEQPIDNWQKPN